MKFYLRPQLLPGRLRSSLPSPDQLSLLPALVLHGGGQRARVHGDDDQRLLVELLEIAASSSSPVQALH